MNRYIRWDPPDNWNIGKSGKLLYGMFKPANDGGIDMKLIVEDTNGVIKIFHSNWDESEINKF